MPTMDETNLDRYGNPPLHWSRALAALGSRDSYATVWLATTRPDGRPHLAGVGALWLDDTLYFTSGPSTRKSRNLDVNPYCSVSLALTGLDLVLEGTAARVSDEPTLARLAERYRATGWPATVAEDALTAPYSAPSAGPPPWYLYALTLRAAFGVATAEPFGATRWRFP
jgi:Pyridoxamine 5'-phosphate oxidase